MPMNKLITYKDLLRYVYGEATSTERRLIAKAIKTDFLLKEQYTELLAMNTALNKVKRQSPSPSSIRLIMEYSRKTTEMETHY